MTNVQVQILTNSPGLSPLEVVLLKGGRVAELPATLVVVAVDKTGTLTKG